MSQSRASWERIRDTLHRLQLRNSHPHFLSIFMPGSMWPQVFLLLGRHCNPSEVWKQHSSCESWTLVSFPHTVPPDWHTGMQASPVSSHASRKAIVTSAHPLSIGKPKSKVKVANTLDPPSTTTPPRKKKKKEKNHRYNVRINWQCLGKQF